MSTLHTNGESRRPTSSARSPTAPSIMTTSMNGHFAGVGDHPTKEQFEHGIQVVDEDKAFNPNLPTYLQLENVIRAGFNYHLISVFGSQSTGKSTLLNHLFGTEFGVMSEQERRQTTKGIWMSKNKKENADGGATKMAENILVMDVEGTDGRERGEDQDFERKSALFALATSEVLIVNIWEHQVGLYQGANMGLLKTVFEVNLQLFLKDQKCVTLSGQARVEADKPLDQSLARSCFSSFVTTLAPLLWRISVRHSFRTCRGYGPHFPNRLVSKSPRLKTTLTLHLSRYHTRSYNPRSSCRRLRS